MGVKPGRVVGVELLSLWELWVPLLQQVGAFLLTSPGALSASSFGDFVDVDSAGLMAYIAGHIEPNLWPFSHDCFLWQQPRAPRVMSLA